ncbi:efflux RND transporter periplasmic adaptor subunit [Solitalea koreensis]|uniref:Barrel-sandwich domain of CusB or HlyD membrane-fusion n=1 Tax=Solitalea koreensis TaxID=543615 RepID=A0A521BEG1_9SPHI|nr:efflux RND transporter periplasmic adaptor subunit [Solitalea koreensis]SMO45476.1 Barrel-sandwich domain of CusB or HlyD membrane-fusion [Solitalea koreensis]
MRKIITLIGLTICIYSCTNHNEKKQEDETVNVKTPVTITTIKNGSMSDFIELNATSSFMQKHYVKANTNGYIVSVSAEVGKYVNKGQVLFKLKTKEAQSIGNTIAKLDSTFKFSGIINIKSNDQGYLTQLNHQTGDYVQDGEQLAAISDMNSFAFVLDLPYELRSFVLNKKTVELILPDGERLNATIAYTLPTVDATSQTQSIVLKVNPTHSIPENLIAKVRIVKNAKSNGIYLPKDAILTNETQTVFWIMKMIDKETAVKVIVKKGIETDNNVEILSPALSPTDKIIVSGNYSLPDTAKVIVTQ